jgi:hypothetical protein
VIIYVFVFSLTEVVVGSMVAIVLWVRGGPDPDSIDTKRFTLTIPD